ncbi:class I SAM-dependent DNA methyltransferase [Leisingera methylohalidivorans]|uniref:Methyltransferase n=1 Tax=Leisingera methylohalidivorans DSM 14336 TaxID=999552 RepID=V9VZ95_9RHOB|nr:class I SAM-dependent methyltransferase [Leisingera methylohalidivorans]AHD02695.1 methyltransferase [Leisingera methylohalidivorans DSM 14336]
MDKQKPGLSDAYAVQTPADSKRLYGDWASTYDQDFAARQGYLLPGLTAKAFAAAGGMGPVLDAGAGTGLCGQALQLLGVGPIDATDLSAAMLAEALRKDVYRDVIEADLLEGIPVPRNSYRGVVSSGTFTHGHLGPEVLPALLRVAAPDAWFALSVNARFYKKAGFAEAFDRLLRGQWIKGLTLPELCIYGPGASGAHKDDTALIALFQKV